MRARNVKPGFFLNDELASLSFPTRLLFLGLFCAADREGYFEWRPNKLHAIIFPYDHDLDIDEMLCNLMALHFITCKNNIGHIVNFVKHQRPHVHETKSVLRAAYEKDEENQCHDMSVDVGRCCPDSLIPDSLIPDSLSLLDCKKRQREKGKDKPKSKRDHKFESFWEKYPRKVAKGSAIRAWKKLKPSTELTEAILGKLLEAQTTAQWQEENGRYIPYPATWLRAEGWLDDYSIPECANKTNQDVLATAFSILRLDPENFDEFCEEKNLDPQKIREQYARGGG
jgi:hypothetical protein